MSENAVKASKGRVRDMTEGNILSHIIMFAIPMVLANICQQLYGIVDTMVAGSSLGDAAIAAIGATGEIYNFILNFAIGINMGCAIIVTQYFGAHDKKTLKQSIMGMLQLNLLTTGILTLLAVIFMHPLLRFMNVPAEIYDDAYLYIIVICVGMVATVAYNMGASVLRAFGNSNAPLIFVVVGSVIHIILDYIFIAMMKTGVVGASIATIISNGIAAVLSFAVLYIKYRDLMPTMSDWIVPVELFIDLFRTGLAMAMTFCVVTLGDVVYGRANNALGQTYITSFTAARRIIQVFLVFINTTASACSTFVSQNWGAKKYDRIKEGIKTLFFLEIIVGIAVFIIGRAFAEPMAQIVTSTEDPVILSSCTKVLKSFFSLFVPLGVLFTFRSTTQGMGRTTPALIASFIEMILKLISAFVFVPLYGFEATCLTEPLTWVVNGAFLAIAYFCIRGNLYPKEEN